MIVQGPDTHTGFKKYISLTRPHTLTASFVPVLVGTFSVLLFAPIRWDMFIAMLIATLLIQSATNMRSEERRVGKECRSRRWTCRYTKNNKMEGRVGGRDLLCEYCVDV